MGWVYYKENKQNVYTTVMIVEVCDVYTTEKT